MNLSFDAKRIFHNNRGLGNYSRDVIRLLTTFYPENNFYLFNPEKAKNTLFTLPPNTKEITPPNLYKVFPNLWRKVGCLSQIKKLNTDIYHGLSQELPGGIHKTNIKTVVTLHDAIFIRFPELYDSFYRKIFIKKNEYSCKVSDKIIAISEQTKQDFIEFFNVEPEKIQVVYQGCNNIFREEISDETLNSVREKYALPSQFLLNVGAIEKRKNLETVIRALSAGKIEIPLVVIGNKGKYYFEIKSIIEKLNLQNQVIFLHGVPTADLPAIYKMAQLFIYPSRFEGFGIPILEALCTGTPVLTSYGSCFEETGGDAAMYVNYHNEEEMAVAMNKILSSPNLQEEMREKGLIHAEKFTDDKIAANLMSVYTNLR
ncbi:glycosyltransferase family 1 protein [Paludibacter sp. 221]|uniref:glycosyltransferase family 4 protein n=1 Tax=Paludibacter sp. 221 TaxID=2302939 RepID=UPI0013D23545|nr:glycosyltransferase family 1 protein [Paludibacter sp. 221]NDV47865.1 glycosyltransferase family 1 protein [Paludibacter sp. 221]